MILDSYGAVRCDGDMNLSFQTIVRVLRAPVTIDSGITFASTILGAGLDLLVVALVSRVLQPAGFGVYAAYLAVMTLIGGVADLGLGLVLTHFLALNRDRDPARAHSYSQMVFWLKMAVGLGFVLVGTLFAPVFAPLLLGNISQTGIFVATLWGGFGLAMSSFVISYLRGYEHFLSRSLYSLCATVGKLVVTLVLFIAGWLTAVNAVSGTALAFSAVLVVGFLLVPRAAMRLNLGAFSLLWNEFFTFGKWVMVWYVLGALIPRADLLLLNGMATSEVVGWYAAATRLCVLLVLLNNSLTIVLVPKISRIDSQAQMDRFLKGWRLFALVVFLVGVLPLEIVAQPLSELVYGAGYLPAVPIFRLLLIAAFLDLIFSPISYLSFAFDQPKLMAFSHLIRFGLLIAGIAILTPLYGGAGAAMGVTVSVAISYVFLVSYIFFRVLPNYRPRTVI